MRGGSLPREILGHVLQFADGKTLLTCRDVSPEFEAAVDHLGKTKNIWERRYREEMGDRQPYSVIEKFHPHREGLSHPKNWCLIYEACSPESLTLVDGKPHLSEIQIGKSYSNIEDIETHGDLVLALVKYNKDFSIFYRILTIDRENMVVDKSCRFYTDKMYITPVRKIKTMKQDAIILSCDDCQLVAVPVRDAGVKGFPKFSRNIDFLNVEHPNGDVLWIYNFKPLLSKGHCFHTGLDSEPEVVEMKYKQCVKASLSFTSLCISCRETCRMFNTFEAIRAKVTACLCYSNLLILGTDTGTLYLYRLSDEADLEKLDLKLFSFTCHVCYNAILMISVMELKSQFVVVCATSEKVYKVHMNRRLRSFM